MATSGKTGEDLPHTPRRRIHSISVPRTPNSDLKQHNSKAAASESSHIIIDMKNIIAIIWDFDKTLVDGYMQDPIFKKYNVNATQHLI